MDSGDIANSDQNNQIYVTEEQLNSCLSDKKYTYSKQISKRLAFLSLLFRYMEFDDEKIRSIIGKMWDELVVNSFTDVEGEMFRKWFSDFTEKTKYHLKNSNILEDFFNEKIEMIIQKSVKLRNYALLRTFIELFAKMNQVKGRLNEVTIETDSANYNSFVNGVSSEEKFFRLMCKPAELAGIKCFWEMILNIESDYLSQELINFLVLLYTKPVYNLDRNLSDFQEYQREFIDKCEAYINNITKCENWEQNLLYLQHVRRVLLLLQS